MFFLGSLKGYSNFFRLPEKFWAFTIVSISAHKVKRLPENANYRYNARLIIF
ncbi:hypothetical protein ACKLNO_11235 [Neisseriaceae bacterium B1]